MAYGLPVLSHDDFDQRGPEVEAIVPGETGDLYELNDSSDMARKIQAWIRDHPSKSEVSTRCIAEIRNRFNAERQVRIIDQAVKDIPAGALELNCEKAIEG
jgi:glycosyltransferase involved in cell wall biosynthesis